MKIHREDYFRYCTYRDIKDTNIANVLVSTIDDYTNFERRLTMIKTIF